MQEASLSTQCDGESLGSDLFHGLAAITVAWFFGNREALAITAAGANIFPFQIHFLDRPSTSALIGVAFAPFTVALGAASAEDTCFLVNGKDMHGNKFLAAFAISWLLGHGVARAIIFAVADVIHLAFVRSTHHPDNEQNKTQNNSQSDNPFHAAPPDII